MKKVVTALMIGLLSLTGISQSDPAQSVRVHLKPVTANGDRIASDAHEANPGSAPFNEITLIVEIPVETGISGIKVQMGRGDGTEIANQTFNFDGSSVPAGMTYQRNGKRVIIGLGKYAGVNHYTTSIVLVDANGVDSQALTVSK